MAKWMPILVAAAGWLVLTPGRVAAWGKDGHEVIGRIADKHLDKTARAAVEELLKDDQFKTLADGRLTNWADSIRGSAVYRDKYPKSDLWHYVNIDVDADLAQIDLVAACKNGDCVRGAILKFQAVLKDSAKPLQERREALFFVAHFVGDLHQPLHCGERNKDRGGNLLKVLVNADDREPTNLHKVWDTVLVAKAQGTLSAADYSTRLGDNLSAEKLKEYQKGTLDVWMVESHKICHEKVYQDKGEPIPADGVAATLSGDYLKDGAATVEVQLVRGGVRLAQLLNDTFKE